MGTVTLSQVLSLHSAVQLYGMRISDLAPQGDLGLGLDPAGPLCFASVRGVAREGRFTELPATIVLSMFGEGEPPASDDAAALAGERIWTMAAGDRALRMQLHQGTLSSLLTAAGEEARPQWLGRESP